MNITGMIRRGEANPRAVLTDATVLACRQLYRSGTLSVAAMARQAGVGSDTMRRCLSGKTWSHLPGATFVPDGRCRP